MRRVALLALLAGCAGIESDIDRAEIGFFFENFVKGKDRGLYQYSKMIDEHVTKVQGGRYQYVAPAHLSNFYIDRAVRGLGGTRIANSDYLAAIADKLLFVMSFDPTGALRSTSCEQLGRLLLALPKGAAAIPVDGNADVRINQIADDLARMAAASKAGEKVSVAAVVERMRALAEERPRSTLSARQIVRVLAAPPVAGAVSGPVREAAEEIGPPIVRDAVLVALRNAAVGLPDEDPDESPLVRKAAVDVIARLGSPVAGDGAAARLAGGIDPKEQDPDVRCALVSYLGGVGGPGAFDACVERLRDLDVGVRYCAQASLQQMTGARVDPTADAWRAWAEKAPALAKANG